MDPRAELHLPIGRLKIMGGRLLMLLALVANLVTTIIVIWLALKIQRHREAQQIIFDIDREVNGERLIFNKGVQTDTLLVDDRLNVDSIIHEQISIVGRTNNDKSPQPEISMNPDYISMQAKHFGLDGSPANQFQFKLDRDLENLEILHEANNVRSIKAGFRQANGEQSDLSFDSKEELELSGNLGMSVHSRDIVLKSKKGITITSGENVIDIRAGGGLFMPNIRLVHRDDETDLNDRSYLEDSANQRHLCIRKSDGSLYRARLDEC